MKRIVVFSLLLSLAVPGYLKAREEPVYIPPGLWVGARQPIYKVGQDVIFLCQAASDGEVSYFIREDVHIKPPLFEGKIALKAGQRGEIKARLDHPGFLIIEIRQGGDYRYTGAAVDPYNIESVAIEPEDFDVFWRSQLKVLSNIPLEPQVTLRQEVARPGFKAFKVILNQLDGRKVYGWVSVPQKPGRYPAILELPAFGSPVYSRPTFMKNAVYTIISIHNSDLETKPIKPYQPSNELDHTKNYYKYAVTAGICMIDYLTSLAQYDGRNMIVTGKSQGGGLTVMVAGLDKRVTHISAVVPAFAEHRGWRHGRSSGFPQWIYHKDVNGLVEQAEKLLVEAEYYDISHFAKRYKGSVHCMAGYVDTVCPPSSVFAAFNQFPNKDKVMIHGYNEGHDWNAGKNWWTIWNGHLKQVINDKKKE